MAGTSIINSANDYYLRELLDPQNAKLKYVIPKYQREYSWGRQQWEDLYDDILLDTEDGPHFLGTIIAISNTEDSLEPKLELIDGQQRMTSLSILLCALYKALSRITSVDNDFDCMALKFMITFGKNPRLVLQSQGKNEDDYVYLVDKFVVMSGESQLKQPKYWGNRRISQAYKYFSDRIEQQVEDDDDQITALKDMANRVKNAVLVKIEVPDHASAFTLFESLNNRGMDLSPIDLIKNEMLARADANRDLDIETAYEKWKQVIEFVGQDGNSQERFLRYYYNALNPMKKPATRSTLIRIYEDWMEREGVEELLNALINAAHVYGLLTGNLDDDDFGLPLLSAKALELRHAGGESGYMLLMWLVLNREKFELLDDELADIANKLVIWFVRRNLTDFPATNAIQRLFSLIIKDLSPSEVKSKSVCQKVHEKLFDQGNVASDEQFEGALRGPIYEDNRGMTRFILSSLAEHDRTDEGWSDLWRKSTAKSNQYYLTIEHILPQAEHMTKEWVESLGGEENAKEIRNKYVHTIGNLTLSGFNSELGTMDFKHKRDRMDKAARNIGYRNGLSINRDVVDKDKWGAEEIEKRTDRLVGEAMRLFAI